MAVKEKVAAEPKGRAQSVARNGNGNGQGKTKEVKVKVRQVKGKTQTQPKVNAEPKVRKLTVERTTLKELVSTSGKGVGGTLPILHNVLMETIKGKVRFTGTNLDVAVRSADNVEAAPPVSVAVPAKVFAEVVNLLNGDVVDLSFEDNRLIVECNGGRTELLTLPGDEYPVIPEVESTLQFELPQATLLSILNEVSFAASREPSSTILQGVLWEVEPQKKGATLNVVATDTHRLARRTVPVEIKQPPKETVSVIVPLESLNPLRSILGDEGTVTVTCGTEKGRTENLVQFQTESDVVVSRTMDGNYPNYRKVIPTEFTTTVTANRRELLDVLRRVSIVARDCAEKAVFEFKGKTSVVTAEAPETGTAREKFAATVEGGHITIAFNVRYLMDALNAVEGENVTLQLEHPLKPALIKADGRDDWFCITMPMAV